MPKVYLSENDRISAKLSAWIYGEMKVQKISQRKLASELGTTQQSLSWKLKHHSFSFTDFAGIVKVLNPDDEELRKLLGVK